MRKTSLANTNQYLEDPKQRKLLVAPSVMTSCAVEGVKVDLASAVNIHIPRRPKKIYRASK